MTNITELSSISEKLRFCELWYGFGAVFCSDWCLAPSVLSGNISGKPLVRRRVDELADAILATLPMLDAGNLVAEGVAKLIKTVGESSDRFPQLILLCCPIG